MSIKFQVKRANNTTWSNINPTLDSGELGFETNTNRLKIGNGSNTWNTLPYIETGNSFIGTGVIFNSNVSNSAAISATKLSFTQNGSNAIVRTVDAKLKEFVSVEDFGAVGDGTTDDTAAIQAAIDYVAGIGGGQITIPIGTRCVIDNDLTIKSNITLKGPHAIVGTSNNNLSADYSNIGGALLVNSANTIRLKGGSALQGLLIHKKGMTFPSENSSLFSGTAVTIEGDDTAVFQSMILGFNQAIYSTGHQRLRLYDLNIDSVSGILIDNCADIAYMSRIHCWPFATIAALGPATSLQRSGTAYKFTTMGDWNKISDCFSYGYFRGIWVDNCNSMTLLNCGADSTGSYSGQIGFLVTGTSTDTRIIGGQTAAQEIGYYIHTASNVHSRIIGTDSWACTNHGVFIDNGDVYISGGIHRDVPNAITNNNATNIVTIDGVRFSGISNIPINNTILNSNIRIGQNDYKNWGPGGSVANNTNLPVVSIASSDPISLPAYGEVFNITGNTSFGTINGGWAGRIIVLKFNDALTVFDGGESLKLKGNFSSVAEDTLTLAHNGAAWFEISRSTASIDFDTVSSVNSATISSSVNHIRTAGYYTTGDEGGANYTRYSTNGSTPAHGGYITSNGGQYVWEIVGIDVNVHQFGAYNNQTSAATTTSAIQSAINYVLSRTSGKGGTVRFLEGNYLLDNEISITTSSSLTTIDSLSIIGAGPTATQIIQGTGTEALNCFNFNGAYASDSIQNCSISDLKIVSTVSKTAGAGVRLYQNFGSSVERCHMAAIFIGIDNRHSAWSRIKHNRLTDLVNGSGIGLLWEGGPGIFCEYNLIDNTTTIPLAGFLYRDVGTARAGYHTQGGVTRGNQVLRCEYGLHVISNSAITAQSITFSNSNNSLLGTHTTDLRDYTLVVFANGSSGSLPGGITAGTTYYTRRQSANTSKFATSAENAAANTFVPYTTAGSNVTFGVGAVQEWQFFNQNAWDTCNTDTCLIEANNNGQVRGMSFVGEWFATATNFGLHVARQSAGGEIKGIQLTGPIVVNNYKHGMIFTNITDVIISNPLVTGNGQESAGTYHGIVFTGFSNNININGGLSEQAMQFSNSQGYGILFDTNVTNYRVNGTSCATNIVGDILTPSANQASISMVGRLAVSGPSLGNNGLAAAQIRTPGKGQGERAAISLYGTFANTPADNGTRKAADVFAGFDINGGNAWGGEYLAFGVGNNGNSNDSAANTSEKMRIKSTGAIRFVPMSSAPASGNQAGDVYFDSSFGKLRVYSNNVWANVSTA